MNQYFKKYALLLMVSMLVSLQACGADSIGVADENTGGGAGVTQGGSQDFGLFKDILRRGEIPGPGTLDELGFFAEHKIELPEANCGQDVCLHGLLGVMGNMISGSNCTMVLVGLNTPIDPQDLQRPALDLAIAVDTSGSMQGERISFVREGLLAMLPSLQEGDRITLVGYGDRAEVLAESLPAGSVGLENAIRALGTAGSTNIYDGLRTAFESLPTEASSDRQRRVILLSDGLTNTGLVDEPRILRLAQAYGQEGVGLTTIGVGQEFNVELMRGLSEFGAGNFYFLQDPRAVLEVFTEEVNTFLVPIAEAVDINIEAGSGYKLRRVHGTRLWSFEGKDAVISIPSLFVAGRTNAEDNDQGRRGGGGAIVAELIPDPAGSQTEPGDVGELTLTWNDPLTGEPFSQQVPVASTLAPGETPEAGLFANASVEKAFVMLNIYVGFEMAIERAASGGAVDALRVLESLRTNVTAWYQTNRDPDIEDDLVLIGLFIQNLNRAGFSNPPQSALPDPWPQD